jgi:hypothetical protein
MAETNVSAIFVLWFAVFEGKIKLKVKTNPAAVCERKMPA